MPRPRLKINEEVCEVEITLGPAKNLAYVFEIGASGWRMKEHCIPVSGTFSCYGRNYKWLDKIVLVKGQYVIAKP